MLLGIPKKQEKKWLAKTSPAWLVAPYELAWVVGRGYYRSVYFKRSSGYPPASIAKENEKLVIEHKWPWRFDAGGNMVPPFIDASNLR